MAFSISDFNDLIQLLNSNPQLRDELRRALFTEEFVNLPQAVQELARAQQAMAEAIAALSAEVKELAEAQKRTEARIEELAEAQKRTEARIEELAEAQKRTEARIEELAEAQKRTEARIEELAEAQKRTEARIEELAEAQKRTEARIEELAEAQKRTETRIEELAEAQKRTETRIEELAEAQKRTETRIEELAGALTETQRIVAELAELYKLLSKDVAMLKGFMLEQRYRLNPGAFFWREYRKLRVLNLTDLDRVDEAYARGVFSPKEWKALNKLDLLLLGVTGKGDERREEYLAVEISWVVDVYDVERAHQRAELLRRLGYSVRAAVGGSAILDDAKARASALGVIVALNSDDDKDDEEA